MKQQGRKFAIKLGSVLLLSSLFNTAFADQYHYNNVLIGDRAAGMGGAYVAIADDPSGLYYNPAGIVYSGGSGFSASANAFHMNRTKYKEVLGGNDWVRSSQVLLPNFFGMIQQLGPGTVGFSYAVVDSALEDQDQKFKNTPGPGNVFDINFNNQDNTYNIGPSYAVKVNKYFSLGLTLYAHYRKQEQIFNQQYQLTDPDYNLDANNQRQDDGAGGYLTNSANLVDTNHWVNSYVTSTEYGIKPMLGIMISPIDKVSLGVTVSKTTLLSATTDFQSSCYSTDFDGIDNDLCQYDKVRIKKGTSNYQRNFPLTINGGVAYFASPSLLLTGNATVYEAMYGSDQPLVNYAAGLEYYLNGQWAVRAGGFTNYANTPTLTPGLLGQSEHIDLYGGSFSVTNFTRTTSITVGLSASAGKGEAQVIDGNPNIQQAEVISATGFISTAYSF